jgi:hypothetical protein
VQPILSLLGKLEPSATATKEERELAQTAKRTLARFAYRHRRVRDICHEELQFALEGTRNQINAVLSEVGKQILLNPSDPTRR